MDDRSHDQLGKKGDEQKVIQEAVVPGLSAEGIDQIGNELKGEKGDADWQDYVLEGNPCIRHEIDVLDQEIGVLEIAEKGDISPDSDGEEQAASASHPGFVNMSQLDPDGIVP